MSPATRPTRLVPGAVRSGAATLAFVLSLGACGRSVPPGLGERDGAAAGDASSEPPGDAASSDDAEASDAEASDAGASDAEASDAGPAEADAEADAAVDAAPAADAAVPPDAPPPPLDLRFPTASVRKAVPLAGGATLVLLDTPLNLNVDWGFPNRELRAVDAGGDVRWRVATAPGRQLLDFAAHPSGDATALFATDAGFRLVRLDGATGVARADFALVDDAVDTDPPQLPAGVTTGPIETSTHDAGAIAALGEDVVVGVRTRRHSVVAHRFAFADGTFARRYRTLAVPATSIGAIGLTGGTYDTFGAVDSQFHVQLAVGPEGTTYVGVRHPELLATRLAKAFQDVFGETLATDPDATDSYVVRLTPDGMRLGTSVVGTERPDEIFGLRAVAGGVWALGRNELYNTQGTGFDAFVARVDGATGAATARSIDVDRGDIAFDAAPLPGGELIVVGASGYAQNPTGASITEASAAFARWLRADGGVVAVPMPAGPRHNEGRFILPLASGRLLVGGMLDGPGTHSADGNLALLTAKGFLAEISLPAP